MNEPDKKQFGIIITALARTFNRKADKPLLLGYWMGLEDLDLITVQTGASRAMRESKFMPTVAELRQLAGEILPADRAALALEAFRKALQINGVYESVDFDDKLINATVRNLGGWIQVDERLGQEGNIWVRKEFERIYQTFLRTGVSSGQALALGGIHEQNNAGRYECKPPLLITDGLPPHRAGLVALPSPKGNIPAGLIEHTLKSVEDE